MNIQVIRNDGTKETIVLTEPLTVKRGDKMNRLVCQTGMEHWFNEDGTYDGWGMPVSGMDMEDAAAMIEAIEKDRHAL